MNRGSKLIISAVYRHALATQRDKSASGKHADDKDVRAKAEDIAAVMPKNISSKKLARITARIGTRE